MAEAPDSTQLFAASNLAGYCSEADRLAAIVVGLLHQIHALELPLGEDLPHVESLRATVTQLAATIDSVLGVPGGKPCAVPIPAAEASAPCLPSTKRCAEALMQDLTEEESDGATAAMGEITLQGTNSSLPLEGMFEFLCRARKNGTLRVKLEGESMVFEFREGEVVFAATTNPPGEERLGEVLVNQGFVTRERLEDFFSHYDVSIRLGEALEKENLVTKEQLLQVLDYQVQQRFYRAFTAEEAAFAFYEGGKPTADDRLSMNPIYLVFESSRVRDEAWKRGVTEVVGRLDSTR